MRLIIKVADSKAAEVKAFLAAIKKPVPPNKGIPGITISVSKGTKPIDLYVRGINITVDGMPAEVIKVGDVVENTKSGNWGVVKSVDNGEVVIKTSKVTFKETGKKTMSLLLAETAKLV